MRNAELRIWPIWSADNRAFGYRSDSCDGCNAFFYPTHQDPHCPRCGARGTVLLTKAAATPETPAPVSGVPTEEPSGWSAGRAKRSPKRPGHGTHVPWLRVIDGGRAATDPQQDQSKEVAMTESVLMSKTTPFPVPPPQNPSVVVRVRIRRTAVVALDAAARNDDTTRSFTLREFVLDGLRRRGKWPPTTE